MPSLAARARRKRRWQWLQGRRDDAGFTHVFVVNSPWFRMVIPEGAVDELWSRWKQAGRPHYLRYGRGVVLSDEEGMRI